MRIRSNRKGVTLIFVISMIVLFMLMATTFLVLSSQFLRGARSYSQAEVFRTEPSQELEQGLYILLRDTRDAESPLRSHSLLADVYGYNTVVRANVVGNSARYVGNSNDSFFQIQVENDESLTGTTPALDTTKNSYLGQLLTFTSGGMQGVTCRIVGHVFDNTNNRHYFHVYPYLDNFYTDATNFRNALNQVDPVTGEGPQLIINGRPFAGTGAGFTGDYETKDSFNTNLDTAQLTAQAFQPNQAGTGETGFLTNYVGGGDVHEDYDAADYQNPFLAAVVPSISGSGSNSRIQVAVLPSFHRPALAASQGGATTQNTFRPLAADHPAFPRLPAGWETQTGVGFEWDVDNDGDLYKDSVWVDPNLPVLTDSSGRTYKRMFAYLVRDMDGLFNLNAHSSRWHLDNEFDTALTGFAFADELDIDMNNGTLNIGSLFSENGFTPSLSIGQGIGPAEINMRTIFRDATTGFADIDGNGMRDGSQELFRLMYGNDGVKFDTDELTVWGRNGQDLTRHSSSVPRPGVVYDGTNGNTVDRNTFLRFYNVSQGLPVFDGSYGSTISVHGRAALGIDYSGQPSFSVPSIAGAELHETEYERSLVNNSLSGVSLKNVGGNTGIHKDDAPFSYAEIERLLRGHDNDSQRLPSRLVDLAPRTFNALNTGANRARTYFNRMNVGAHSFDMPVTPTDFVDELRQILLANGLTGTALEEQLETMLPVELFAGVKFDVNRIFGDGQDDDGANIGGTDLVVDNHWGPWSQDLINTPALLNQVNEALINEVDGLSRSLDLDYDGVVGNADGDEHLVRYHYARYIYVMLRTILRTSEIDETDPTSVEKLIGTGRDLDGDGNIDQRDVAIFCAQLAINIVDFRDKDSIMTPFEFDLNPFNGWGVDGNPLQLQGEGYIVFGCERPPLLLTETFAFHDRRTEDTDDEDTGGMGSGAEKGMDPGDDNDTDQRLKPVGSAFIELYNPWGTSSARTSDIYNSEVTDHTTNNGVDLRRVSLTPGVDNTGGVASKPAPAFRIVMTQNDIDLDVGDRTERNNRRDNIERVIYFAFEDNGDMNTDVGEYLKSELQYDLPARVLRKNGMFLLSEDVYKNHMSALGAQQDAVLGTAAIQIDGTDSFINPIGRRSDVTDENTDVKYNETRSIIISPGAAANSIVVRDLDAADAVIEYSRATLGIPIEDFNISEPISGYDLNGRVAATTTTTDAGGTDYLETVFVDGGMPYVFDAPLDKSARNGRTGNDFDNFPQNNNQTVNSYRVLHLQRLANPLVGWHPDTNPYLTIDTMPIDLAVFDGVSGVIDDAAFADSFATKERGENRGAERNLWRIEPGSSQPSHADASATHRIPFYLENPNNNREDISLGGTNANHINFAYDFVNNPDPGYMNPVSYPWLAWNNRPFINQYEIMLVPHTSSSRLLRTYSAVRLSGVANRYEDEAASVENGFGHLVNFFQGSQENGDVGPDLHRIFDYMHVPSRFADTETFLDNTVFGDPAAPDWYLDLDEATGNADSGNAVDDNDHLFSAPHNFISNYREPGKVNINTIYTNEIWTGVNGGSVDEGGHIANNGGWSSLIQARRGSGGAIFDANPGRPSYFAQPFRGSHGANLTAEATTQDPTDMGLLREFNGGVPFMDGLNRTVNASRHPYFKYLSRARLANLTTTRSNVYAVWITVGYFEVDEETGQLGEEIGLSTGQVERHRAFYMIDRSIPVGFEPGKNHNVDKTIMLRRFIE